MLPDPVRRHIPARPPACPEPVAAIVALPRMQHAFRPTDWSVLSTLLRLAQREGWRVEFAGQDIFMSSRWAIPGATVLPAVLVGQARAAGWRTVAREGGLTLRHPAVRQQVSLRLTMLGTR